MLKKVLLSLVFLSGVAQASSYLPPANQAISGGYGLNQPVSSNVTPTSQLSKRVSIKFGNYSTAADGFYWAVSRSASGQYQVPAAETLYCNSMSITASALELITFGYTTATFTDATATPPASAACYSGNTACAVANFAQSYGEYNNTNGYHYDHYPVNITFSANDYPMMYEHSAGGATLSVTLDCILVP